MKNEITIDMLSVGDRVMANGKNIFLGKSLMNYFDTLPKDVPMPFMSRIPATPENTKQGDWVIDTFNETVFQYAGSRSLENCYHMLKKELAEHLANKKPLFADVAVGDLVRFSNWQVCEIVKVDHDSFSIKEDKKHNFPNNKRVYLKSNGKCWVNPSKPIHATDLIKKGSAEWAWEMMVKGEFVDVDWDKGSNNPYYIKDNIVRCGFGSGNLSEHQTKESWLGYWGNAYPSDWQLYEPEPSIRIDELEDRMFSGISITSNGKRIDPLKIYVDESENKNPRTKSMTKQQRTDLFNKGKKVGFKLGYEQGRFDEQAETKSPTYDEVKAAYENGRKQGYQEGVTAHCKMCRDDELMRSEIDAARKEGFAAGQATIKFCPMCSNKYPTNKAQKV